ncbi:MAG: Crp/Fnr family transcriptional regulator [Deltaproteobacteria bacterium]|nr:Crp/Fnr family transcriptional regulator [Deltaproteobacteria bacterium]
MQEDRRALWYLKKIPLFSCLSAEVLNGLAETVVLEEARKRRVIYMPGDPGDTVFFVNAGRVKISRVTADGKELTLAYRGPGELFGETCIVDGGPRQEMAEAMENALVMQVDREQFEALVRTHAAMGLMLSRALCARRRELEARVEDLVFKDVNAKLAELLLDLCSDYGVDDERGTLVAVKITHQEMANMIGSTRETVSLTLSQFKQNGLITTDGRQVIVTDQEGLRALS